MKALYAYLKSLPAVDNAVPAPFYLKEIQKGKI